METIKGRHIPAELMEPILLKLPVKSLFRFSAASKLWNSIIFGPNFARDREMIVFTSMRRNDSGYFKCIVPLSSMSSDNPTDGATPFDFPRGLFLASCGYLWCFEFEKSLLLYNPSLHTYRKLPNPEPKDIFNYGEPLFFYGLGYDSVCDDYKILKIQKWKYPQHWQEDETRVYSLRNDCWRKIETQLPIFSKFLSLKGLFVSGAIHWLITLTLWIEYGVEKIDYNNILSFDLSEEKFGLIELPDLLPKQRVFRSQCWGMNVFEGKLRVYLSCLNVGKDDCLFRAWVMEDYESKLWTKEMEFDYGHMPGLHCADLRPFYFHDDAGNLVRAVTSCNRRDKIFIYKEDAGSSTLVEKNFGSNGFHFIDYFTYVESLVSPLLTGHVSSWKEDSPLLTWHVSSRNDDDDDGDDNGNDGGGGGGGDDDDDDDLMMMVETLGRWRSYN